MTGEPHTHANDSSNTGGPSGNSALHGLSANELDNSLTHKQQDSLSVALGRQQSIAPSLTSGRQLTDRQYQSRSSGEMHYIYDGQRPRSTRSATGGASSRGWGSTGIMAPDQAYIGHSQMTPTTWSENRTDNNASPPSYRQSAKMPGEDQEEEYRTRALDTGTV